MQPTTLGSLQDEAYNLITDIQDVDAVTASFADELATCTTSLFRN